MAQKNSTASRAAATAGKEGFPAGQIGRRLRAYRMSAGLTAQQVAERLGMSRAALFRLEAGQVVKVSSLERVATLLSVPVSVLLGVQVEYYERAVGYLERMRQIEQDSDQVLAHFDPVSLLVTSDAYSTHLRDMLLETVREDASARSRRQEVDAVLQVLAERKAEAKRRQSMVVSLMSAGHLERFARLGMVGRLNLPADVQRARRAAARREIEHIIGLMECEPIGIQLGVIESEHPASFQICRQGDISWVGVSPFRLGELPNIHVGVSTITSDPFATALYEKMFSSLWTAAAKGARGADVLRRILARV